MINPNQVKAGDIVVSIWNTTPRIVVDDKVPSFHEVLKSTVIQNWSRFKHI